ncbi:MAG: hypothetical protein Q8M54_02520 [Desulfobaccales bacterium]|nr:hypothetical protein [Desulfobaccales bacterium]
MAKRKPEYHNVRHLCNPVLSVMLLLLVSLSLKRDRYVVHYDTLPRYLRGVARILRISQEKLAGFLSSCLGLAIHKIKHGNEVPSYRDLHLKSQEVTATIIEQLIPSLKKSKWVQEMEKLLGMNPALAYAAKQTGEEQIFRQLVPLVSCYWSLEEKPAYLVAWDHHWPKEWGGVIKNNLPDLSFEFFVWPTPYLAVANFFWVIASLPRFMAITLCYLLRRGVVIKKVKKPHYKIITEFVDPLRLNKTPYDVDFWVDGQNFQAKDIFFFLTREQERIINRGGYDLKKVFASVKGKGYEIRRLDDFAYPLEILKKAWVAALGLLKNIAKVENLFLAKTFLKAWSEFLNFYPLFAHTQSDNFIYLTFPNGQTGLRYNSGIVTGLCRNFGIRSVGYQTRAIHSRNYEYCFDCFDLYLAWGPAWYEMQGEGMQFIDKVAFVGCPYLDYPQSGYRPTDQTKKLQVCIFPSDINLSGKHHYTLNYALTFMKICAGLAISHQDINFVIKNKEPIYTQIIMSNKEFADLYLKTKNNFKFLDRARHEYFDLLLSSDIIIAMGFTTPGTEGLLLGKRTIYYNELNYGGQAFKQIPDLIARNPRELTALFEKALHDYNTYNAIISSSLDRLDPFRDAQALERITGILVDGRN